MCSYMVTSSLAFIYGTSTEGFNVQEIYPVPVKTIQHFQTKEWPTPEQKRRDMALFQTQKSLYDNVPVSNDTSSIDVWYAVSIPHMRYAENINNNNNNSNNNDNSYKRKSSVCFSCKNKNSIGDDEQEFDFSNYNINKKNNSNSNNDSNNTSSNNNNNNNNRVANITATTEVVVALCTDQVQPASLYKEYSDLTDDDFLRIDVCGMIYETLETTIQTFPNTLLGDKVRRQEYFNVSKNAYYFDRSRECFESILGYYQNGGRLVRPANVPLHMFLQEVEFFELGEDIAAKVRLEQGVINKELPSDMNMPKLSWQRTLWRLFEIPDSSFGARLVAMWSLFVIALSIAVFCMETMPFFQNEIENRYRKLQRMRNKTYVPSKHAIGNEQPWFSLEMGCIVWFTIEYVVRLAASPSKREFLVSMLNIIDLLAILPYFIILTINSATSATSDTTPLSVLRVVRLVRVFRVFKLSRHSIGLQILGHTLRASISELGMLVFFLAILIILFSSAIFYAESHTEAAGHQNATFTSIPDAFWYSIVTMTTVGYGDQTPRTLVGKLVGSLCAVTGVLTIALPVPVIVSNFSRFYRQNKKSGDKSSSDENTKKTIMSTD